MFLSFGFPMALLLFAETEVFACVSKSKSNGIRLLQLRRKCNERYRCQFGFAVVVAVASEIDIHIPLQWKGSPYKNDTKSSLCCAAICHLEKSLIKNIFSNAMTNCDAPFTSRQCKTKAEQEPRRRRREKMRRDKNGMCFLLQRLKLAFSSSISLSLAHFLSIWNVCNKRIGNFIIFTVTSFARQSHTHVAAHTHIHGRTHHSSLINDSKTAGAFGRPK